MNALAGPLDRGREELLAAQALLDAGFPSQAVSRASTGAINAATAALLALGETPLTEAAWWRPSPAGWSSTTGSTPITRAPYASSSRTATTSTAPCRAPRRGRDVIAAAKAVVAAAARIVDERARPGA